MSEQTKKLRVACVGLGGMGAGVHLPCHLNNPKVEVVALCDILPSQMEKAIERHNLSADIPCFVDFKEMIDTIKPDAIDIATPNKFHSIIACYALERSIHVFCEKPDAINQIEAQKMKTASEESGAILMVMRNNRYALNSQYAKKYIEEGNAGDIYCGRCGWLRRRGIPGKGGWFTTKELSGGGPLIDLGVHLIDLSIWLMGNPKPVAVSGCTYSKFADNDADADSIHAAFGQSYENGIIDVEDLAMGFIRFDNGACLQIEFSWASNIEKEIRFVELRGDKAGIKWNGNGTIDIFTEKDNELVDLHPDCGRVPHEHWCAIEHFVDMITEGKAPDYVPEQGLNMIKILDAIYESAKTGREVLL